MLQEMTVSSYVPNDALLAGGIQQQGEDNSVPSMLLLTGPNYSGKSVYMKQVSRSRKASNCFLLKKI